VVHDPPGRGGRTSSELLVAQLVHLRAVDDFLVRDGRYKQDVVACHYLADWTAPGSYLGEDRDWINAQVAHLTMNRRHRPDWNPLALTRDVLDGLERFSGSCVTIGAKSPHSRMRRPSSTSSCPGTTVSRRRCATSTSSLNRTPTSVGSTVGRRRLRSGATNPRPVRACGRRARRSSGSSRLS